MAGTTTRLVLPYPSAPDSNNVPQDLQRLAAALDGVGVAFLQGALSARPAAAVPGRFYLAADQSPTGLYYDTGTAWVLTNASLNSLFTAKGDVLAASAAGAPARVAVGTDGTSLVARASYAAGVGWEPVLGLPLALPGATAATRFAGGTVTGAPTTGTFAAGDLVVSQDGNQWVCTAAGTPGTFVQVGALTAQTIQASNVATNTLNTGSPTPSGTSTSSATTSVLTVTNPSASRSMLVKANVQGFLTWSTNYGSTSPYYAQYRADLLQNGTGLNYAYDNAGVTNMMSTNYYQRDAYTSYAVLPPSGNVTFQGAAQASISIAGSTSVTWSITSKATLNVIGWTI